MTKEEKRIYHKNYYKKNRVKIRKQQHVYQKKNAQYFRDHQIKTYYSKPEAVLVKMGNDYTICYDANGRGLISATDVISKIKNIYKGFYITKQSTQDKIEPFTMTEKEFEYFTGIMKKRYRLSTVTIK